MSAHTCPADSRTRLGRPLQRSHQSSAGYILPLSCSGPCVEESALATFAKAFFILLFGGSAALHGQACPQKPHAKDLGGDSPKTGGSGGREPPKKNAGALGGGSPTRSSFAPPQAQPSQAQAGVGPPRCPPEISKVKGGPSCGAPRVRPPPNSEQPRRMHVFHVWPHRPRIYPKSARGSSNSTFDGLL